MAPVNPGSTPKTLFITFLQRPSVKAYLFDFRLFVVFLVRIVAVLAQRLQVHEIEKQLNIAAVRNLVVNVHLDASQTALAHRAVFGDTSNALAQLKILI
jgi:hypothetical protein